MSWISSMKVFWEFSLQHKTRWSPSTFPLETWIHPGLTYIWFAALGENKIKKKKKRKWKREKKKEKRKNKETRRNTRWKMRTLNVLSDNLFISFDCYSTSLISLCSKLLTFFWFLSSLTLTHLSFPSLFLSFYLSVCRKLMLSRFLRRLLLSQFTALIFSFKIALEDTSFPLFCQFRCS